MRRTFTLALFRHPLCTRSLPPSSSSTTIRHIHTPAAAPAQAYDVVVVGGGLMGASSAWSLASRGARVALVEQFEPAHTLGSSHGDGRIARLAYPENTYVRLMQHAYGRWEALQAATGSKVYQRCGSFDFGPPDADTMVGLEATYKALGIPYTRLSAEEASVRFPHFSVPRGDTAIYQEDGSVVFASRAVQALWKAALMAGAEPVTGAPVTGIDRQSSGGLAVTVGGDTVLTAAKVVVASGGWANHVLRLADLSSFPLTVTNEQTTYFCQSTDEAAAAVDHTFVGMPTFIGHYYEETPIGYYGIPNVPGGIDGVKVAVMFEGEQLSDCPDPSTRSFGINERMLRMAKAFAAKHFPHLNPHISTAIRCIYTSSPDRHFIIGPHPEDARVVVATGFSGHGFKFGPSIGDLVADDVLEASEPSVDLGDNPGRPLFAPDRPALQ